MVRIPIDGWRSWRRSRGQRRRLALVSAVREAVLSGMEGGPASPILAARSGTGIRVAGLPAILGEGPAGPRIERRMKKPRDIECRLAGIETRLAQAEERLEAVEEELSDGVVAEAIMDAVAETMPRMIRAIWEEKGPEWVRTVVDMLCDRLERDDDADWWKRGAGES